MKLTKMPTLKLLLSVCGLILLQFCFSNDERKKNENRETNWILLLTYSVTNPSFVNGCLSTLNYQVIEVNKQISDYKQRSVRVNNILKGDRLIVNNTSNDTKCITAFGFSLCDFFNNQFTDSNIESKICANINQRTIIVSQTEKEKICMIDTNYLNVIENSIVIDLRGSKDSENLPICTYTIEVKR
ncbi:MAG: hypothetical protein SFU98_12750 [Leptospiraceae bacterium]|nr:hypothetical protein [Leptospiraceae bacterium]